MPKTIPATVATLGDGTVSAEEFQRLDGLADDITTLLAAKEASDADLTAIAALSATGLVARTAAATYAERTLAADESNDMTITNGDGVAGSPTAKTVRYIVLQVIDYATDCDTGDGKVFFTIPEAMNGWNITAVHGAVATAGTTGTMDIQFRNMTDSVDLLSTKLTIDSTEVGSDTAAAAAVINTSNDDVATNDRWAVDIDAVQTTAAKGLVVRLKFEKP